MGDTDTTDTTDTTDNTDNNSIIMNLENLTSEYNAVLTQYQTAITNYLNDLSQQNTSGQVSYLQFPGMFYNGTGTIANPNPSTPITSITACQSLCSTITGCSGATFSNTTGSIPTCNLSSGIGSLSSSSPTNTAIISTLINDLLIIQGYNTQLININSQIIAIINSNGDLINSSNQSALMTQNTQLEQNNQELINDESIIRDHLLMTQQLDEEVLNSQLVTKSRYLYYIVSVIFTINVIYILFKVLAKQSEDPQAQIMGSLINKVYIFIVVVVICVFLFYYFNM